MNKRGVTILDVMLILIFMFILAITIIVSYQISHDYNESMQETPGVSELSKNISATNKADFLAVFDKLFLVVFVGLALSCFVGATMLNTHPVIFVISIFLLAGMVFLSAVLSNVYEDTANDAQLANQADDFVIIPFLFENYPKIAAIFGILVIIGLFAKLRGEDG